MRRPARKRDYSVIIPTCNRPDLLRRCLECLRAADPPTGKWEVLVVDNSDGRSVAENQTVVRSLEDERFIYCEMPPLGLMAARHKGAELATGEVLCFIDDDSFVDTAWLLGIEEAFDDQGVALVTGPIRGEFEIPPPSWLDSLWDRNEYGRSCAFLSLLDFGTEPKEIDPIFVWGCNYAIRRDVFYQVRGSHPDYLPSQWSFYQGDGECGLSIKVKALGHHARYSPKCSIKHLVPARRMTFEYLGTRAYFVGLGASFTDMRRSCGLGELEGVPPLRKRQFATKVLSKLQLYGRDLMKLISRRDQLKTEVRLRKYLKKRFWEGYRSHQREVKERPQLLEYVMRKDYLDETHMIPCKDACVTQQAGH